MRKSYIAFCSIACLALLSWLFEPMAAQKSVIVTVAAGALDRRQTVVSFTLPKGNHPRSCGLKDKTGQLLPLQVDAGGQATFVLPELKANTATTYRLAPQGLGGSTTAAVQANREEGRINISAAGRQVLSYQMKPNPPSNMEVKPIFLRGGYIHPVFTPSGRIITDDYPPDHYHHHGIWFAWTKTEFQGRQPDFWNMGDGTGKVDFVALDEAWGGPVNAGFRGRHRYVDLSAPKPTTVLNEEWQVMVYLVGQGPKPYTMFDLISTQNTATANPLILPEYRYGGVGFRGHRDWLDKDICVFLTSEGKNRADGHGTRARWCHIGGPINGQMAGIAVLDHPANFRAPQPMRINPDQPFFCYAPSQMGQWEIAPGKPYVSRYRFVVYDGPPDKAELDRLWNDYANPPQVTVASTK